MDLVVWGQHSVGWAWWVLRLFVVLLCGPRFKRKDEPGLTEKAPSTLDICFEVVE